jgi:hypothetical protein
MLEYTLVKLPLRMTPIETVMEFIRQILFQCTWSLKERRDTSQTRCRLALTDVAKETYVKRLLLIVMAAAIATGTISAQTTSIDFWQFPDKVVEKYWEMGIRGELLTSAGWKAASNYCTKPNLDSQDGSFYVYSQYYGIVGISTNGDQADVDMEYLDAGRIDSNLHYSAPPKVTAFKTAFEFHLVRTPNYMRYFGPDGKTEVERKLIGSVWKIEGAQPHPWTTVNTAIRYVLETRSKTDDPVIKKNADETIAKLLTLH